MRKLFLMIVTISLLALGMASGSMADEYNYFVPPGHQKHHWKHNHHPPEFVREHQHYIYYADPDDFVDYYDHEHRYYDDEGLEFRIGDDIEIEFD